MAAAIDYDDGPRPEGAAESLKERQHCAAGSEASCCKRGTPTRLPGLGGLWGATGCAASRACFSLQSPQGESSAEGLCSRDTGETADNEGSSLITDVCVVAVQHVCSCRAKQRFGERALKGVNLSFLENKYHSSSFDLGGQRPSSLFKCRLKTFVLDKN